MKSSVKKITLVLLTLLLAGSVFAAEAQDDLFYINVPIIIVSDHVDAYIVNYTKGSMDIGEVVLPKDWFKTSDVDKCRVRSLAKGMTPYMTVIYKNDKFQKIYLNMPANRQDPSWKILPSDEDISGKINKDKSQFKVEY